MEKKIEPGEIIIRIFLLCVVMYFLVGLILSGIPGWEKWVIYPAFSVTALWIIIDTAYRIKKDHKSK